MSLLRRSLVASNSGGFDVGSLNVQGRRSIIQIPESLDEYESSDEDLEETFGTFDTELPKFQTMSSEEENRRLPGMSPQRKGTGAVHRRGTRLLATRLTNAGARHTYLRRRSRAPTQIVSVRSSSVALIDAGPIKRFVKLEQVKDGDQCREMFENMMFSHEIAPGAVVERRDSQDIVEVTVPLSVQSYHLQGDAQSTRATMIRKRSMAKKDLGLSQHISRFWDAFDRKDMNSDGMVARTAVIKAMMKFIKALYPPEEFDEEEAYAIAVNDWEEEMQTKVRTGRVAQNRMSYDEFCASVLEIVDLWTAGYDSTAYIAFSRRLFDRVTCTVAGQLRWKKLKNIVSMCVDDEFQPGSDVPQPTRKRSTVKAASRWNKVKSVITLRSIRGASDKQPPHKRNTTLVRHTAISKGKLPFSEPEESKEGGPTKHPLREEPKYRDNRNRDPAAALLQNLEQLASSGSARTVPKSFKATTKGADLAVVEAQECASQALMAATRAEAEEALSSLGTLADTSDSACVQQLYSSLRGAVASKFQVLS